MKTLDIGAVAAKALPADEWVAEDEAIRRIARTTALPPNDETIARGLLVSSMLALGLVEARNLTGERDGVEWRRLRTTERPTFVERAKTFFHPDPVVRNAPTVVEFDPVPWP